MRSPSESKDAARIKENEERYHSLFNLSNEGILIMSLAGKILEINEAFAKMHGYTLKELLKMNIQDLDVLGDRTLKERADIVSRLRLGETARFEVEHFHKDGHVLSLLVSTSLITLGGEPVYQGSHMDITDRKDLERDFRVSERIARIGSYKVDFLKDFWVSSETLDEIFGIGKDYRRSVQGWLGLVHPDDRAMMGKYLHEEVIAKRQIFNKEYRIVRKTDGAVRWVNGFGEVTFDKAGDVVSMVGSIQDITERKATEEGLRKDEIKFRNLFNNAQVGMFRTRLDGSEALDANDKYLSILEAKREDFVGKPSRDFWMDPEERAAMVKTLEAQGHVEDLEFRLRTLLGNERICVTSLKLYPQEGVLEGSIQDITERKRSEQDLREKMEELEKANKLMTGRELKMVEMKKKLAECEAQLQHQAK